MFLTVHIELNIATTISLIVYIKLKVRKLSHHMLWGLDIAIHIYITPNVVTLTLFSIVCGQGLQQNRKFTGAGDNYWFLLLLLNLLFPNENVLTLAFIICLRKANPLQICICFSRNILAFLHTKQQLRSMNKCIDNALIKV